MEKARYIVAVTTGVMLFHTAAVCAQGTDTPNISFNGYGTVGVVHSNEDRADFISSTFAPDGAGHSDEWSAEVDSRFGLQLTAGITPKLSGIVQVVVEQRPDDTYEPTLEWANLKYEITPHLYVRVGRIVLPGLLASEYRKVGYAMPWVRPPSEVYGLQPVTKSDGVDAGYEFHFGGFTNTIRFHYGRKDVESADGSKSKGRDIWGLTGTAEQGSLTFNLSYLRSRVTVEALQSLFNAFRQFGPEGESIADRFDFDNKSTEVFSIGGRYDPGDWFLMGEWIRFDSRTVIGDRYGGYVSGGLRFGPLTAYATLARMDDENPASDPGLSVTGLPPPLAAGAQGLNLALNNILGSAPEQNSVTLGARWDFFRNLVLKVQYQYIDLGAGSPGILINEQPGFNRGGSVSLFSATIDFVF